MTPAEMIRSTKNPGLEPDFYLYTDGSGSSNDRLGTSVSILIHPQTNTKKVRTTMSSGSSVRLAEMQALLDGLGLVWNIHHLDDPDVQAGIRMGTFRKPRVLWITDRQELAYAITAPPTGKLYKRRHMRPMWAAYGSYELWLDIEAKWISRNDVPEQAACDMLCGTLREELKGVVGRAKSVFGIDLI